MRLWVNTLSMRKQVWDHQVHSKTVSNISKIWKVLRGTRNKILSKDHLWVTILDTWVPIMTSAGQKSITLDTKLGKFIQRLEVFLKIEQSILKQGHTLEESYQTISTSSRARLPLQETKCSPISLKWAHLWMTSPLDKKYSKKSIFRELSRQMTSLNPISNLVRVKEINLALEGTQVVDSSTIMYHSITRKMEFQANLWKKWAWERTISWISRTQKNS